MRKQELITDRKPHSQHEVGGQDSKPALSDSKASELRHHHGQKQTQTGGRPQALESTGLGENLSTALPPAASLSLDLSQGPDNGHVCLAILW